MAKGWGDTKPDKNQKKWEENIEWYKYMKAKEREFNHLRLVGPIMSAAYHWVEVTKQDGTKVSFPMTCAGYDPETETFNEEKCPACIAKLNVTRFYFQNAIDRKIQEDMPAHAKRIEDFPDELKRNYRQVGDQSWSPIRVTRIPVSCAAQLRNIVQLNRHKVEDGIRSMDISDAKYGLDVHIKFDPDQAPANKYNALKGEHTPLTDEELAYKLYNLEVVECDVQKMEKDLLRLKYLKPEQAHFTEVVPAATSELSVEADGNLPDVPEEEPFEEEAVTSETDHLSSLDRISLKRYIVKNGYKDKVKITTNMSDEDIRVMIRGLEKPADGGEVDRKSCFGKYEAKAQCFECTDRTNCITNSE